MAGGVGRQTDGVVFHPVDAARWPDFVRLFESRGGPKYCWCMAWRGTPAEKKDARTRKSAMAKRVRDGVPIGILGYVGGEPVAWCSIAPRETYRDLGGVEEPGDAPGSVWSIVCFFIKRTHRKQGMMRRLLDAAAAYAREHGATSLEAYPVDPDSPSYRFMGFVPFFEAAGFREVGRAASRRHVIVLFVAGMVVICAAAAAQARAGGPAGEGRGRGRRSLEAVLAHREVTRRAGRGARLAPRLQHPGSRGADGDSAFSPGA